jgi:hypothetical protein
MNENDYLRQVAALTGLQHFVNQGPWGRKSGSAMGNRDGYVTAIGISGTSQGAAVVVLLRFKNSDNPEAIKAAVSAAFIKNGKIGEVGSNFLRWEWKYSFTKPKPEEVAKLAEDLRAAIKSVAHGFDGKCETCASISTPALTLMNGLPTFICAGCQEKVRHELDQAAVNYDAITPNYPNGLILGAAAAALGGLAWGLVAYGINRIFLWGAILIGYLIAMAVIKGTGKVTRFGQIMIPLLTVASVLFGDSIFYTLIVMKEQHMAFSGKLLTAIITHLWEIETKDNGVLSLLFALVGAGYALYAARKPKFKAVFQPLGAPNA